MAQVVASTRDCMAPSVADDANAQLGPQSRVLRLLALVARIARRLAVRQGRRSPGPSRHDVITLRGCASAAWQAQHARTADADVPDGAPLRTVAALELGALVAGAAAPAPLDGGVWAAGFETHPHA